MQTSDAFTPRSTTTVAGVYALCNTSGSEGENPSPPLCEIEGNAAHVQREEGRLAVGAMGRICPQASPRWLLKPCWQEVQGCPAKHVSPLLLHMQGSAMHCEMRDNYRLGDKWK